MIHGALQHGQGLGGHNNYPAAQKALEVVLAALGREQQRADELEENAQINAQFDVPDLVAQLAREQQRADTEKERRMRLAKKVLAEQQRADDAHEAIKAVYRFQGSSWLLSLPKDIAKKVSAALAVPNPAPPEPA